MAKPKVYHSKKGRDDSFRANHHDESLMKNGKDYYERILSQGNFEIECAINTLKNLSLLVTSKKTK
ncbi:MAG: hypothetical protein ACRCSK_05805 [Fusobacteriaceae bacterium]